MPASERSDRLRGARGAAYRRRRRGHLRLRFPVDRNQRAVEEVPSYHHNSGQRDPHQPKRHRRVGVARQRSRKACKGGLIGCLDGKHLREVVERGAHDQEERRQTIGADVIIYAAGELDGQRQQQEERRYRASNRQCIVGDNRGRKKSS